MNDKQLHDDWYLASHIVKDTDPDIRYRLMTRACWALQEARSIVFGKVGEGLLR